MGDYKDVLLKKQEKGGKLTLLEKVYIKHDKVSRDKLDKLRGSAARKNRTRKTKPDRAGGVGSAN